MTGSVYPPPCLFSGLVEALPAGSFCDESPFYKKVYDVNRANLMASQWCNTCHKRCPLFGRHAESDFEVAGLPCTDASIAGLRKFEQGPTAKVFLAHAKIHIERRTPLLIIENVQDARLNRYVQLWKPDNPAVYTFE